LRLKDFVLFLKLITTNQTKINRITYITNKIMDPVKLGLSVHPPKILLP